MIMERQKISGITIRELCAPDIETATALFFSEYDEREQQTRRAMAEMFCDMDKPVLPHKAVNDMVYQLLWQYDDRSVGFIRVTGIREGSEACVSLHLSGSLTTEREVIAEGFRHSVAKIFEKFDLKRIILVGKGRDRGIPEELLIREYGAFRIGFVHLDTEPLMYALYRAPYGGEKHPFAVWWRKLKDMYRKRKKSPLHRGDRGERLYQF